MYIIVRKSHRYVNGYCNSLAFVPKYVTNVTWTNYTEDFPGLQILLLTDPSIKVKNYESDTKKIASTKKDHPRRKISAEEKCQVISTSYSCLHEIAFKIRAKNYRTTGLP